MRGETAGFVASLAARAAELSGDGQAPTVTIETDAKNVFIQKKDGLTLAVFRVRRRARAIWRRVENDAAQLP